MNCIIIDDESHCIKTLSRLLQDHFPRVEVVATCPESMKAYDLIIRHKPDLLFLDIEMPHLNGFDLLSKFDEFFFDVIFTTAYDTYAIKAIKFSALDYLLKPIDKDDLAAALDKIVKKQSAISKAQLQVATAMNNKQLPGVIALPSAEGLIFTPVNEIVYCSADGSYCKMYMSDNSVTLLSRTLGDVDDLLNGHHFFRIHNSILINLKQVKKYIRGEGGEVVMSNGHTLQVARMRKTDFLNIFTRL